MGQHDDGNFHHFFTFLFLNPSLINKYIPDRGVTVSASDVCASIRRGDLGCFYALLSGTQLLPINAGICVTFALMETGNYTDIMAWYLVRAYNVQLTNKGLLAAIIEKWTEVDMADLDREVKVPKFRTIHLTK